MTQEELPDELQEARLESALRAALQRENAPTGFAERLEARIAGEGRSFKKAQPAARKLLPFRRLMLHRESRLAIAAAVMLAILLPVGWGVHHHAEVARGEAAKEQVMMALRLTGTQLRAIKQHTHTINAGIPEGDSQ